MRVLVVATDPSWTPGTRLMAALAAGLASRGDVVAIACASRSAAEAAIERTWPRLTVRSVSGEGWWAQGRSLRGIVTAVRPDAVLAGTEHDTALAAYAFTPRGATGSTRYGIVRRFAAHERDAVNADDRPSLPWRARFALSRAKSRIDAWGARSLVLGWPVSEPAPAYAHDADVQRLPVSAPHLLIVPGATHDERTATALRAAAHLRTRHESLRVTLVGELAHLQATRLHAASLGLTPCLQVSDPDALLHHEWRGASAAWVTAPGDAGAIAVLAAMQQHIPVVVPADVPYTELVAPQITGFISPPEGGAQVVADLARLLSDPAMQRAMGEAAAARASREHDWDAFVDDAADRLARAAGAASTRITRRPSLTPA